MAKKATEGDTDKGDQTPAPVGKKKADKPRPEGLCPSCDEPLDTDYFCEPCDAIFAPPDGDRSGDGRQAGMAERMNQLERKMGVLDSIASIFGVEDLAAVDDDQIQAAKATLGDGAGGGMLGTLMGMMGGGGGGPFGAFFGQKGTDD